MTDHVPSAPVASDLLSCASQLEQGVAMLLCLESFSFPSIVSSLEIKDMRNNLGIWSIPLIQGFKLTPKVTEIYNIRPQPTDEIKEKIHHYSGFVNNQPVCSLSLSICGYKARLDDLATVPAFQKKGLCNRACLYCIKTGTTAASALLLFKIFSFRIKFISANWFLPPLYGSLL